MQLDKYQMGDYTPGASKVRQVIWLACSGLLVSSWLPGSWWRVAILRLFGADIGTKMVIKPRVSIKYPWRLVVGDHCWIGERVWIDNLASVVLGNHVCLSQGAYLCTGSHDWSSDFFTLETRPIVIEDHVWICAKAMLAPGAVVKHGAVLLPGSLGKGELQEWTIFSGVEAVGDRRSRD